MNRWSLKPKDIFITADDEIILYPKEGKEHRTAYGGRKKYRWKCDCPKDKYANGHCDNYKKCNKFECFWDGHDCDDIQPLSAYYIDKRASYHQRNRFYSSNSHLAKVGGHFMGKKVSMKYNR